MSFRFLIYFTLIAAAAANCQKHRECPCELICLSSGRTMCLVDYKYMRDNGVISHLETIIGRGSCLDSYSEECLCCSKQPVQWVCGTDHKSYRNLCELRCVASTNYGILQYLKFDHYGLCTETSN